MEVAVNPQRRSRPGRRRNHALPQLEHGSSVDEPVRLLQVVVQEARASGQRHTSPGIVGSLYRGGLVECPKELPQRDGRCRKVLRWSMQRTLTGKPRGDGPRPGKPAPGRPTRRGTEWAMEAVGTVAAATAAPFDLERPTRRAEYAHHEVIAQPE